MKHWYIAALAGLGLIFWNGSPLVAQLLVKEKLNVPVWVSNEELQFPWTGGMNAIQANSMDLNGNGTPDLVFFDRSNDMILPFLKTGGGFEYAPHYRYYFPDDIRNWMLLADYDGDGLEDLFTYSPLGMRVFRNVADPGEPPDFEIVKDPVFTQGNVLINLQINATDIPAIVDIDGDGDLDVLTYNFALGTFVEWHRNMSQERYGHSDSLEFNRENRTWGNFEECFCDFAFGMPCPPTPNLRLQHAGGKSILALDINGNGLKDVLIGHEECEELFYLPNTGTQDEALMLQRSTFPGQNEPMAFSIFPAAYQVDVVSKGSQDLIVSPNLRFNDEGLINFKESVWLYENQGRDAEGQMRIQLVKKDFLQDQTLDLGENAAPALLDIDGDGDLDLLVAYDLASNPGQKRSQLALFINEGSNRSPQFHLVDEDFLGFSEQAWQNVKLQVMAYQSTIERDLIVSGYNPANFRTEMIMIPYLGGGPAHLRGYRPDEAQSLYSQFRWRDKPWLIDLSGNFVPDMLVGTAVGNLRFFRNTGTRDNPQFELEDDAFLSFGINNARPALNPAIGDINRDGKDDLVVLDGSGRGRVIFDFKDEAILEEILVSEEGWEDPLPLFGGTRSQPYIGEFGDKDFRQILIGTTSGGIRWMEASESLSITDRQIQLNLFPNPVKSSGGLNYRTNRSGEAQLINLNGQVLGTFRIQEGEGSLDLPPLPQGIYLFRFQQGQQMLSKRLIIY